jgi:uncharacterized protein involved in exopolysaccharide biosynthesis
MENNTQQDIQQTNFTEGTLNFKVILGKFLAFLPFFIISILISLSVAYLVNRYATPKFALKTSLLIKDKGRGAFDGAESFLQGSSLLMQSKNIENEIGILKSRSLIEETLKNINLTISYYGEGKVKKSEKYKDLPFIVEIDTNHFQCYGVPIFVKFLNNNRVEISSNGKPGKVLIPYSEQSVEGVNSSIETKNFDLAQYITLENLKIKITLLDKKLIDQTENKHYFVLNTKESLIKKYANSFAVKTINKQSSIVEITKETNYPEKDVEFLDALCRTYINMGVDDKAQISKNTMKFIDVQLNELRDTLQKCGKSLIKFQVKQ